MDLVYILNDWGAEISRKLTMKPYVEPGTRTALLVYHKSPDCKKGHWTVEHNGTIYDPASKGDKLWPAKSWVIVDLMKVR